MIRRSELSSDALIWESFLSGNRAAFSQLYQEYAALLFQYGKTLTFNQEMVRDAVQDLFVELWNRREGMSEVRHVKAYLLKAFRYKLMGMIKKDSVFKEITDSESDLEISVEDKWVLSEIKEAQIKQLKFAIALLPVRQREVLHLKYFQNLSTKEIARLLVINPQSVTNLLYRGLLKLKQHVLKREEEK